MLGIRGWVKVGLTQPTQGVSYKWMLKRAVLGANIGLPDDMTQQMRVAKTDYVAGLIGRSLVVPV